MTRLTAEERNEWARLAAKPFLQGPAARRTPIVEATAEARLRYIRFATDASVFYKGIKPLRFGGNHWKL